MEKVSARPLDKGMGVAVARRTVFRKNDAGEFTEGDMGQVADRVSRGNMGLLDACGLRDEFEELRLRNAIASAALITSGRHLQHGDAGQHLRNMEVFSNCSTASASFSKFYLLLNGSGVGRSYDDEMIVVDWRYAPALKIVLSPEHMDMPRDRAQLFQFGKDWDLIGWGATLDNFTVDEEIRVSKFIGDNILPVHPLDATARPALWQKDASGNWVRPAEHPDAGVLLTLDSDVYFRVPDSREGWGQAFELYESMAFRRERHKTLILDFSDVRPLGSPIGGMQGRPASGPLSVIRGFLNVRNVVDAAGTMAPWEQAMRIDHHLSVEVQVGGARRAARMATKRWDDPGIFDFIRIKSEGGLWTSNNSVTTDREFWSLVAHARLYEIAGGDVTDLPEREQHAWRVFIEATRCGYINGEPGFINADLLEDFRTGFAREKPVYAGGEDFGSKKYKASFASGLLRAVAEAAAKAKFPVITNPCGEIPLHATGGYCVISDFAPLFACPEDLAGIVPGYPGLKVIDKWDRAVEDSVRLGVRFLMRVNLMDSLYGKEVARTNRIGIGPTGLHEYAYMRFGLTFRDLLDDAKPKAQAFWLTIKRFSDAAKDEAARYAAELGVAVPHTVTTIKPAGTTSKLYGLTEGAHLPARRQYIRWVQFRGQKLADGTWAADADPLLAQYEAKGYPVRELQSFKGMSIVGFPTMPLASRLMGDLIVTAPEATPEEQYQWLRLLEKYWIGSEQGAQVSYTLKIYTDKHDIEDYRRIVLENQPTVRCCSIMPSKPDTEMGYEYLPEEEVDLDAFIKIVEGINDDELHEDIDVAHLQCASGACPI